MTAKHFILATAGHVDHGKSALVKALTSIDPDRLPEEKKRGITIELGFAHLELVSPNDSEMFSVGVVDVPGHEDFVRKMISGTSAIDLALLVVAADDGWMPQTEEHFQILTYLGVPRLVVALTKVDLVESVRQVEEEVRSHLRGTSFADAAVIATVAPQGRGLPELRAQLAREFASLEPQADIGKPRLHVDRAFSMRGIGTVITGTVIGGTFRRGETVTVQPAKASVRIRSVQNHHRAVEEIGPGARGALNLADVPVARDDHDDGIRRGDVVTPTEIGNANDAIDVIVKRSNRLGSTAPNLRNGARVRVQHGTGNFPARIFLRDSDAIPPGETALAELRLATPMLAFVGDRVVVRDFSQRQTLAGGVVLDPDARSRNFRTAAQKQYLETCRVLPLTAVRFIHAQLLRDHIAARSALLLKSCFSADEVSRALDSLATEGKIVLRGEFAADSAWWISALNEALSAINAEHRNRPQTAGLALARLANLFSKVPAPVFDALVADLSRNGVERTGDIVRRTTHLAALPQHLQKAASEIRDGLAGRSFDPPSRRELVRTTEAQQALRFLIETNQVVEINSEVVLGDDAFKKMRAAVIDFIRQNGPATVGELRQELGSSRRIMVPFLERLDRDGVTRRAGDKRMLIR